MDDKEQTPARSERVTREALYALVWAEPMLKVAKRYNVSSSYLARICTALNVPRPERGYWAKLAVGEKPAVPKLPAAQPGDDLAWSPGSQPSSFLRAPAPRRPSGPASLPKEHGLIASALAHFKEGKVSSEIGYLKPYKKLLVDVVASQQSITEALSFANELFLALEKNGNRVTIAPAGVDVHPQIGIEHREDPKVSEGYNEVWSPGRPTVVYIGTVAIGLTVVEMSEHLAARHVDGKYVRESEYTPPARRGRHAVDRHWTTTRHFVSGRLSVQAYATYPNVDWTRRWHQCKGKDLRTQIQSIVRELNDAGPEIARQIEVAKEKAEIERQRWEAQHKVWEREEAEKRAVAALKDSQDELLRIIEHWSRAQSIEEFFQRAAAAIQQLPHGEQSRIVARLRLGRQLIGDLNPLSRLAAWKAPNER